MHVQLEEMIIKLGFFLKKKRDMEMVSCITKISLNEFEIRYITCLNLYLILLSLFRTCRTPLPLLHFFKNSTDFKELSVHVSNIFYKQNY